MSDTEEDDDYEEAKKPSRSSRLISAGAKIVFLVAVFAYLLHSGTLTFKPFCALASNWNWGVYALLLMLPQFALGALRFRLLLYALDLPGGIWQAFSWTMIGSFFDIAMPLSNGGDVVKAYYVGKTAGKGRRSIAVMSVFVDRVVGLLALFVFAWLVCLLSGDQIASHPELTAVSRKLFYICSGSFIFFFILVSPWLEENTLRKRLMHILPFHQKIEDVYNAFAGLRHHLGILCSMLLISLVIQILGCASLLCLGKALNFTAGADLHVVHLEVVPALVVLPLALFFNTFGVAGGFGVGEVAFDKLFKVLLGINGGAQLALLFHCMFVLTRLLGLPFFLWSGGRGPRKPEVVGTPETVSV